MAWVESGFSLADAAAVVHVIKRRARKAGVAFADMAVRYSALDADTPRAALARQLPAGDEPTFSKRENERWSLLRAVAAAALDGRISSPCRGATHWGGPLLEHDMRRAGNAVREGRWRRVSCKGALANAFYAEVLRSAVVGAQQASGAR